MLYGIAKVIEECGELNTEIGKVIAYPDGNHPDGKGPLYHRIQNEAADAIAALVYMMANNPEFVFSEFVSRANIKIARFDGWGMAGIVLEPPCATIGESPKIKG